MKVSAEVADSPASFQPLKAQTSAGARRPSGRRSQRSGCIRSTVPRPLRRPPWTAMSSPEVTIAGLRAGDTVDAVFACSRKDRLTARSGTPYLALELRDRTGAIQARAFKDADVLSGPLRARRPRARARAGSSASATSCSSSSRDDRASAEQADPAAFLPVAYRNVDELEGFLEHLAREVHDAGLRGAARAPARRRRRCAPQWRRAPVHPRTATTPTSAACSSTPSRSARSRSRPAQLHPRLESGPADHRRARARPRQDARVHLRRRDRPHRGGPPARPRRARRSRSSTTRARAARTTRRLALAHCVLTPPRAADARAGGRFGSAEALALYRLNALDASVKGALEHGLP